MELPQLMVMCVIRMESCIKIMNVALIHKLFLIVQMETLKLEISKKVIPGFHLRRFYLNLFKRMLNYNYFFFHNAGDPTCGLNCREDKT